MARLAVLAVPALALLAGGAAAQPTGGTLPFIRHDGDSFVDVRVGIANGFMEDISETTEAIDVSAQYMVGRVVGVYGALGAARVVDDVNQPFGPPYGTLEHRDESPTDLDAGALLRFHDDDGNALTLTAGISAPTVVNQPHIYRPGSGYFDFAEPTDGVRSLNLFAARVGVTPSLRRGAFVLAGHFGFDVAPSAADPITIDFAAAIGGEVDGTTIAVGVGGSRVITDNISPRPTVLLGGDLAHRFGRAQVWAGARIGTGQLIDMGVSLEGGVRWSL